LHGGENVQNVGIIVNQLIEICDRGVIVYYRVKEVDGQIAVFLRTGQGFEYAIYFRVYAVFH